MTLEKPYRSFVKALSWRLTGTVDTMVVSYIVTGKVKLAVSIGAIELFTKVGLYYMHERVWNKLSFGRVKGESQYDI